MTNTNINFLVDKYIPKSIDDIFTPENEYLKELNTIDLGQNNNSWKYNMPDKCYFHKEIFEKLKKISVDDEMPHIIFYGNQGSGKKTMINLFLEMVFGKSIYKLDNSKYMVTSSGNIENEIFVKQSDHHIIIEPNNNNFDRYLIQEIVKEYAKKYPLCIFEKSKKFKVVQINHLDNISYYAQTSLRRTIEKYSKTCRFVTWCYSLSKVIEPLRSRCLCIQVPTQTDGELIQWMYNIIRLENINMSPLTMNKIIDSSDGNLKNILWKIDMYKYCNKVYNSYEIALVELVEEIFKNNDIKIIRDYVYKMMITNISSNVILKNILDNILKKLENCGDVGLSIEIIEHAAEFEYRLSKSRRDIIHIEAFIMNVIELLSNKSIIKI